MISRACSRSSACEPQFIVTVFHCHRRRRSRSYFANLSTPSQSQNITGNLLPTLPLPNQDRGRSTQASSDPAKSSTPQSIAISKKADLAISLSPYSPPISGALSSFRRRNPVIPVSQMQDAYAGSVPLVAGIEVKQAGGDGNEGLAQLAVWAAAGLERAEELSVLRREHARQGRSHGLGLPLPLVGFVVVGHSWELYIAWKEMSGTRVSLPPAFSNPSASIPIVNSRIDNSGSVLCTCVRYRLV